MRRATEIGQSMRPWLIAIIAAAALSGCGGSSDAARTASPVANQPSASAPAIVRADAICQRLNTELAANLPKKVTTRILAALTPRNAALEQKAVSELAKLEPPKGSAKEWQQVISYRRALAHALTELTTAATADNQANIKRLSQYKQEVRRKLRVAGAHVGFSSCQKLG
jgi:hypothetical protein